MSSQPSARVRSYVWVLVLTKPAWLVLATIAALGMTREVPLLAALPLAFAVLQALVVLTVKYSSLGRVAFDQEAVEIGGRRVPLSQILSVRRGLPARRAWGAEVSVLTLVTERKLGPLHYSWILVDAPGRIDEFVAQMGAAPVEEAGQYDVVYRLVGVWG